MQCNRIASQRWGLTPKMTNYIYIAIIRPMLSYAAVVWWQRSNLGSSKVLLNHVQRLACLGITGALRTTPTAALEVLTGITPLDMHIRKEAAYASFRLKTHNRWRTLSDAKHTSIYTHTVKEIPILAGNKDLTTKTYHFDNHFKLRVLDRKNWKPSHVGILMLKENTGLKCTIAV